MNNRFLSLIACALVTALTAVNASAKPYVNQVTGITVEIPDSWNVTPGEHLNASTPDGELHLFIAAVGSDKELAAALHHVDAATKDIVTDVHVEGEHTSETVHTLLSWHIHGNAKADGHPVEWIAALVQHGDHILLIIGFGTHDGLKKHSEDAATVFASALAK